MKKITQEDIMNMLELAYDATLNGIPTLGTAEELGDDYLSKSKNENEAINKLINWQVAKCTTSGFITGLGGIVTMPIAIPANISSTIYVQTRMIASIAYIKGYDIRSDMVKTLVYMCLCGNAGKDIAKQTGIKLGLKITESMIKKIPGQVLREINKKVGFRLLTKFGQTGVINLGKMIPIAGGFVGGGFDLVSTKIIGKIAKETFV
ncbi:EcsC family protein [Clostridium sp. YIM B02500]|uniref:EcsC family protein n=1 Tax=Clostridium sp. YIM B02500 TaxID=2910681 RepID=UPI001EECFA2A|nr:EcsC family protein [Clostridium sp. YIM B02500]